MIKKGGKSEHLFVTHKRVLKKNCIILALFGKKQALLLAFNAFFTSTLGESLVSDPLVSSRFVCRVAALKRLLVTGHFKSRPHAYGIYFLESCHKRVT